MIKNSNLRTFTHPETQTPLRVIETHGSHWFIAKDILKAAGYQGLDKNASVIASRCTDARERLMATRYQLTDPADRKWFKASRMLAVNRSGVFTMLRACQLPMGQSLVGWITLNVLPEIEATEEQTIQRALRIVERRAMTVEPSAAAKRLMISGLGSA